MITVAVIVIGVEVVEAIEIMILMMMVYIVLVPMPDYNIIRCVCIAETVTSISCIALTWRLFCT